MGERSLQVPVWRFPQQPLHWHLPHLILRWQGSNSILSSWDDIPCFSFIIRDQKCAGFLVSFHEDQPTFPALLQSNWSRRECPQRCCWVFCPITAPRSVAQWVIISCFRSLVRITFWFWQVGRPSRLGESVSWGMPSDNAALGETNQGRWVPTLWGLVDMTSASALLCCNTSEQGKAVETGVLGYFSSLLCSEGFVSIAHKNAKIAVALP